MAAFITAAQAAHASSLPADFKFGSDPGHVSLTDAGFLPFFDSGALFELVPTAVRANISGSNFTSYGFLQEFEGLGGTNSRDFVIEQKTMISGFGGSNNRRFGVSLFGNGDLDRSGIFAGVIGNNDSGQREVILRKGLNGDTIIRVPFLTGGFEIGEAFTFKVEGKYSGTQLTITLTVTNGMTTATASETVNAADYTGTMFGGCGRLRKGWAVDYQTFSAALK